MLSQAGQFCPDGTLRIREKIPKLRYARFADLIKTSKQLVLFKKLLLHCGEFACKLSFTGGYLLQPIFREAQARFQALDSFGHDMVVIRRSTEKLSVLRVHGASAFDARVKTSRAVCMGGTYPTATPMLASVNLVFVAMGGIFVFSIRFGAVAYGHEMASFQGAIFRGTITHRKYQFLQF